MNIKRTRFALPQAHNYSWTALGCVLPLVAMTAQADSGYGVDTSLGNAMNPAGVPTVRALDPDGLGLVQHSRTPTGFLVQRPYAVPEPKPSSNDWTVTNGWVEFGGLLTNGDDHAARFREYKDLDEGAYLNSVGLQLEKQQSAAFINLYGGGLGEDDQFAAFDIGKYNSWRIRTFYKETPHVFTSSYRSLWNGVGSSYLALSSLPPGGTANAAVTDANIGDAALQTPYSTLKLSREKGGVKLEMRPADRWNIFASYTNEQREGARPFGLVSGGAGGTGGVETAESIDYTTHDFLTGLQYSNQRTSVNLTLQASMFRNHIDTLTVENPMFLPAANNIAAFPRAVFDLYPDNDFYSAKLEYARALPNVWNGNFTLLASASSAQQDEQLIPYTPYPGAVVNGVAGGSWDSTASLYRQSADAQIDSRLVDAALSVRPVSRLDLRAKVRWYETSNDLDYLACNTLTGQWGRLINDGSANAIVATPAYQASNVRCNIEATAALGVVPSGGNIDLRSIPYEYTQLNYVLDGDLAIGNASSINFGVEREEYERAYRERTDTHEDKFRLGYVNRGFGFGTLRLSAELDQRRGSTYNPDPYMPFYSIALGPLPTAAGSAGSTWIRTNDLHRKYDVAERDQAILNARFNFMLGESVDVGVALQGKDIKYPDSDYGRNDHQRLNSASLDINWQPLDNFSVYGNYSYQEGRMEQAGLQNNANCPLGQSYFFLSNGVVQTTPINAGQSAAGLTQLGSSTITAANFVSLCGTVAQFSPLFPTSRTWTISHRDRSQSFNFGGHYDFKRARLYLNYTRSTANTAIKYTYNPDALGLTQTQALIGTGFPDITDERDLLEANVVIPLSRNVSMRLMYLYESSELHDWHYDGIAAYPTPSNTQMTFLDSGPLDYSVSVVGMFFTFRL